MDIEIIHDPKEAAMAEGLRLDPARHEVLPACEWLKAAKRATGRSTLLLYKHRITGQFVLASVIFEPDVVMELEAFPYHPGRAGVPLDFIVCRCAPQDEVYKRIMDKMKEASYRRRFLKAETEEERKDSQRWLRKAGYEVTARNLDHQPFVGEAEGGEKYQMAKEELQRLAKVV
jgi:hypothetical protein